MNYTREPNPDELSHNRLEVEGIDKECVSAEINFGDVFVVESNEGLIQAYMYTTRGYLDIFDGVYNLHGTPEGTPLGTYRDNVINVKLGRKVK